MAKIKIPIKIDGFKCVEDMAQAVLNYTYEKTLKEWDDSISEPKTNADRIRSMTDEELALFIHNAEAQAAETELVSYVNEWLDWLKEEAKE